VAAPGLLPGEAARVIDATGKIVLPGGIEPHAHIAERVNREWAGRPNVYTQSPDAASRAAVFGGVTTILDFASLPRRRDDDGPPPAILDGIEARSGLFSGHSYTDFAFHFFLFFGVPPETIGQIGEAVQQGVASFKVFTNGRTRVPYGHLDSVMAEVAQAGGIMAVHAEDDDVVNYMTETLQREGRDQGYNLPLVHNNLSEDLSFRAVIQLARHTGAGVYFVHTTAKEGVDAVAEARADGLPVYAEALHNYLHFTADDYKGPLGTAIHTYPAIKSAADRDALIAAILDGRLSTTATDEYTVPKDVKLQGQTIHTVCGGHNGIETRIPVAFTKLVQERGMPLGRFADVIATNAAKILGLYPRKGAILPGSDADLLLLDPTLEKTLSLDDLHADADYSIWEGFTCRGYPVMTLLRGKVIVENGALLGSPSDGEWLPRKIAPAVLAGPAV
ncbi:MAG: amidohydrolase family protein, partial [Dehalococcoidia bacterium]